MIRTVHGDIADIEGSVLAHEHLRIDLRARKNASVVLGPDEEPEVIKDLRAARELGLALVVDLSVPGSHRDIATVARIAEAAGVAAISATGFYWDPFPEAVLTQDADTLAATMIAEVTRGVEGTGLTCGIVKVGTPKGAPDAVSERLFRAAAQAAGATGAAVITHTSALDQAAWQIALLADCGLPPERTLISHFTRADIGQLVEAGRAGVYLGIDQIGFNSGPSYEEVAQLVAQACREGLERQLILSTDMARRTRLTAFGGTSYGTMFTEFLPRLRDAGLTEAQISTLLHDNPLRLLHIAPGHGPASEIHAPA